MNILKREWDDFKSLLNNVPTMVTSVFILSVVLMNLMASKELYSSKFLCINCGLALSWIPFLCMDCICKRFGPKASTKISILAMLINISVVIIFKILSMTPGRWAAYYSAPDSTTGSYINAGLNNTFGMSWYVVTGSAIAMLLSSIVNSLANELVGKMADKGDFKGFVIRSFISTGLGQWIDNFVFSALVSHIFFGWNWMQVIICATTSMLIELACEAIFSPLGYKISKTWEKEGIGQEYILSLKTNKKIA